MRATLLFIPMAIISAPALAQSQPTRPEPTAIPPELKDPRLADRLVDVMQVLSKSFLELPAGEVQAALEGRQPTSADKQRKVSGEAGLNERELREQIEQSRPAMRQGLQTLVQALPAMMKGMAEAGEALERAADNMPRPNYPKR